MIDIYGCVWFTKQGLDIQFANRGDKTTFGAVRRRAKLLHADVSRSSGATLNTTTPSLVGRSVQCHVQPMTNQKMAMKGIEQTRVG
jgi:hypothetical protein